MLTKTKIDGFIFTNFKQLYHDVFTRDNIVYKYKCIKLLSLRFYRS